MSKALDYLIEVRPEAMKNYFGFLKEAGKHLDPKTRAIISVITKVDKQTDAGFRQYLKRALHEGVTANEILDALLLAFPSLGLTKIVWAMDILLEMDILEFRPENLYLNTEWHDVIGESELNHGQVSHFKIDGKLIYIYAEDESIHVYDSQCPHQSTLIDETKLDGCQLTCPKHHWKFDLKTGDCIEIGNKPLFKFKHKLEKGRLYVYW